VKVNVRKTREAYETAKAMLLSARKAGGFWVGCLSSSALSTATAVSALCVVDADRFSGLIAAGVTWLVKHQNRDGGWGDTVDSPSNLATTMLVQAAFAMAASPVVVAEAVERAEDFLRRMAGTSERQRVDSLRESYGEDRTFAVPILMNCALARRVDWDDVPTLPFELARLPRWSFSRLRLHVVSYALPALIAIGQLIHKRRPTLNPVLGVLRDASIVPTLNRLIEIQPESGGFLEATPLTSFVVMSLAAAGRRDHVVTRRGIDFLTASARDDGSWPIDTNLSTWVTTQAIDALTHAGPLAEAPALSRWLLDQQHACVHPYTQSQPGGWAWTKLTGGVPDADDTSGALVALAHLGERPDLEAVRAGVRWLIDLQNRDGGWPTFCRGWGKLPFDRSAPDLTAHAIRAIRLWHGCYHAVKERRAVRRAMHFLSRTQNVDGSWSPLWFGNQFVMDHASPVYGTARVLAAMRDLGRTRSTEAQRAVAFLTDARNKDGGWGGAKDVPSTVEETALALRALADATRNATSNDTIARGCRFLVNRISRGALAKPAPIGLYFASLWYSEKLYPVIWSVAALGAVLARGS